MKKCSRIMRATATYGVLIITLLWTISSIYWMIKSSLTLDEGMCATRSPLLSNIVTFDHYVDLIYSTSFTHDVWNSFVIAATTTIVCLAIDTSGSYIMTWLRYPGRSFFRNSIIILYLMPTAVLSMPIYVFVSSLGLYDNGYALLIMCSTFVVPYRCYMFIGYFKAIPYTPEEAALTDGYDHLQTLWYIIMPIVPPRIAVAATFTFIMTWNEYLYTIVMTTSNV